MARFDNKVAVVTDGASVSALACFPLSDRASFTTGSCHLVDGGYVSQ